MQIRNVRSEDAVILRQMAIDNPPLEEHTPYTYWVMCSYSNHCSYALTDEDKIVGYVMCLEGDGVLFIWQLCVLPEFQGRGYSQLLLDKVFNFAKSKNKPIQVSIEEENIASVASFNKICKQHDCTMVMIGDVHNNTQEVELIYQIDFNKRKNQELSEIHTAIIAEFGTEKIEEIAKDVGFDVSMLGREFTESEMSEAWPAIVGFVAIDLGKIDKVKAKSALMKSGIPEMDINIFMGM